jgi:hypothetical protein
MVVAVHLEGRGAEDLGQPGGFTDVQHVAEGVAWLALAMAVEVLDELAAQGDVQRLLSAADAEGGHVRARRPARDGQLQRVDLRQHVRRGVWRFAVVRGVDVGAAGQDEAVQVSQ